MFDWHADQDHRIAGESGLRFGPIGENFAHICVDMQRMFAENTAWHAPWMTRVLPKVARLVEAAPEHSIFTRFVPPASADDAGGAWHRYYERWQEMTLDKMDDALVGLVPELERFVPPGLVIDKHVYSPWLGSRLAGELQRHRVETVIVSGTETEVCVLATVLGAVDLGYRVIIATDAICSSADPTHDAMLGIYQSRFGMQVETALTPQIVAAMRTSLAG